MISEIDLLPYLRSSDRSSQLGALRSLKNSVIGHAEQKEWYLERGVLDDLLRIINAGDQDGIHDDVLRECMVQAGVVLGSFAHSKCVSYPIYETGELTCLKVTRRFQQCYILQIQSQH